MLGIPSWSTSLEMRLLWPPCIIHSQLEHLGARWPSSADHCYALPSTCFALHCKQQHAEAHGANSEKDSEHEIHVDSDWEKLRSLGLLNKCLKTRGKPTCGKILAHAKAQITSMREWLGIRLCIFKIGVTANPSCRFNWYLERGYTCMWVIAASDSLDLIHMLEAALISEFSKHVGCKNKSDSGGEGALNRTNTVSYPPYYVYVAGGRADQHRWVG